VAEFLGLLISLVVLTLVLLLLLTFLRLGRLSRELEDLTERVQRLETPAPARDEKNAGAGTLRATAASDFPFRESASAATSPEPSTRAISAAAPAARVAPVAPVAPAPPALEDSDLETRIGGRGLLYTGVLVLLLGVSFFLRYAFDNDWINETARVVLGAIAGLALIGGGLQIAGRGLTVFGQALMGTGLAILYLAIYAALNFYLLVGAEVAFAGMVLVTLGAAALADRERSQALAFIAVGGGFLTPFLVGGDENAQLTLFTYDALLVAGTLVLAVRHNWMTLNALSYTLTFVTVVAWAGRYYTEDQWLRTVLFLTLFCVLFLLILRATSRLRSFELRRGSPEPSAEAARTSGATARLVTGLLWTAPLFYHIGVVIITAAHPPAIHVYLIAFTAAGLWLTVEPHRPWLRLLILLGGFAPLFGTMTLPEGISWIRPNVVTIIAVAALQVLAIIDRVVRQEQSLGTPDLLALHLTGLGLFGLLYQALQPAYPDFRGALAAIIAMLAIGLWQWLQTRDRVASLNAAALAFTLAAIGVAVQFDGPAVVIGWAAEGAAAAWLGVRASNDPFRYGGLLLWGFAAVRLVENFFETPAGFTAIVNARSLSSLFVIAMAYAMAWMIKRYDDEGDRSERTRAVLHIAASALTLMWITAEIRSFWEVRYDWPQAYLYKHVMLSLAWGLYGAALIVAGMWRSYAPGRYIGITIIAATVLKVFLSDLWQLGGIYRVIGFIGFGVLLVMVSYLYQKRVKPRPSTAGSD